MKIILWLLGVCALLGVFFVWGNIEFDRKYNAQQPARQWIASKWILDNCRGSGSYEADCIDRGMATYVSAEKQGAMPLLDESKMRELRALGYSPPEPAMTPGEVRTVEIFEPPAPLSGISINANDHAGEDDIAKFRFVCPEKLTSDKLRNEAGRKFVVWAMRKDASMTVAELADFRTKFLKDYKCAIDK
jgi:hypothetical protein